MTLVSKCDHDKIGIGSGWTMLCRYVRRLLARVLTFIEFLGINSAMWFLVLGTKCASRKPCIMRLVKTQKICVAHVFLEPIKNSVSPRSMHLEAAYLKALLFAVDP